MVSSLYLINDAHAQFTCDDGCVIDSDSQDDNYCDCPDCSDESKWNCTTCAEGIFIYLLLYLFFSNSFHFVYFVVIDACKQLIIVYFFPVVVSLLFFPCNFYNPI